jgi:hypothetical protein
MLLCSHLASPSQPWLPRRLPLRPPRSRSRTTTAQDRRHAGDSTASPATAPPRPRRQPSRGSSPSSHDASATPASAPHRAAPWPRTPRTSNRHPEPAGEHLSEPKPHLFPSPPVTWRPTRTDATHTSAPALPASSPTGTTRPAADEPSVSTKDPTFFRLPAHGSLHRSCKGTRVRVARPRAHQAMHGHQHLYIGQGAAFLGQPPLVATAAVMRLP